MFFDDMFYVDIVVRMLEVEMEVFGVEIFNEIELKYVIVVCQNVLIVYINIVLRYC